MAKGDTAEREYVKELEGYAMHLEGQVNAFRENRPVPDDASRPERPDSFKRLKSVAPPPSVTAWGEDTDEGEEEAVAETSEQPNP